MHLQPYLFFKGDCEAAFKFYERCLGGKIEALLTHAGTPAEKQVPAEWRNKIMHARLVVGDAVLMGSDVPPEHHKTPQGFSVTIHVTDPSEAERVFRALADNGKTANQ
ncbi:MAG: glyoxalase/bleomycin resistance/extradiol dioxygenase family protein [Gammaproteobacteria bacterium]|nr:MAG: glyoxalase/bleomycin resistance/extradiol dioxygenase family protein [Gammaproteobacteria bacterium]